MGWSRVIPANCCLLLLVTAYCTGFPMAGGFNVPANIQDCADCHRHLGAKIQHIQRLQRIKQQILLALGLKSDRNINTIPPLSSNLRSIDGKQNGGLIEENVVKSKSTKSGGPLFFSVSEKLGEKESVGLVQFVINTGGSQPADLEVLSAHLWLLVKTRGPRRRGRKVVLKVFEVTEGGQTLLTYLKTRVRKTSWHKLSLPISLIQRLLAPPQGKLKLRIACRRCGRRIKVVLPKHRKHLNAIKSSLRQLKTRHKSTGKKKLPFLVINTRVKTIRHS